jgi:predicted O-methyltransferase YrrM
MMPSVERARVRRVIERLALEGRATALFDDSDHQIFPVAASVAEGGELRNWIVREGASRTIEIGLGYAISTLFVCDGLIAVGREDSHHIAIDPFQESRFSNLGLQLLGEAGVSELVEHQSERSQIALPRLVNAGQSFDLAFVDGNHRFDSVFVDLFYLGLLVRLGGVIFIDDYQLPAIARASSFFLTNRGWRLESVSSDDALCQWAVLRTAVEPDDRPFTHFVDF